MKNLIYIAGAFRAPTHWGIVQNVRRAEYWALKVWRTGDVAVCPHLNTANFQGALPDHVWLDGDLVLMLACDGVLLTPRWGQSSGSVKERKVAVEHGLPVFHEWSEYLEWRKDAEAHRLSSSPLSQCELRQCGWYDQFKLPRRGSRERVGHNHSISAMHGC